MGNRDEKYTLEGMIKIDEAFLEKATPDGIKLKRGKGSQKHQNVAIMAESSYLDEFCHKLNRRYFGKRLFDRMVIAAANNYW